MARPIARHDYNRAFPTFVTMVDLTIDPMAAAPLRCGNGAVVPPPLPAEFSPPPRLFVGARGRKFAVFEQVWQRVEEGGRQVGVHRR